MRTTRSAARCLLTLGGLALLLGACELKGAGSDGGQKPLCGNGAVDPGEDCDSGKFRVGPCHKGTFVCLSDCTMDPKSCAEYCGDGAVNGSGKEECDELDFTIECEAGKFTCKSDCTIDKTACTSWCGDGKIAAPEECDPKAPVPTGLCYSGTVSCAADCTLDHTKCQQWCGDGVLNGKEACDGSDFLGPGTCHDGSKLACTADCKVNPGTCKEWCGDGKKNGVEQCDGTDYPSKPCAGAFCEDDCTVNDAACPTP